MGVFSSLFLIFTLSPIVILAVIRDPHSKFIKIQEEDSEIITKPYYAVDPVRTDQLAYLERNIFTALSELDETSAELQESCKLHLSNYLKEYEKDSQVIQDIPEMVTENPLLTFRMIRRIVKNLLTDIRTSCGDEDITMETVHQLFSQEYLTLPTENDLKEAILGILRIHYIYGLNATSELSHGILNGVETNVSLSGEDCLALANGAMQEFSADKIAYQWLVAAQIAGKGEDKQFKEELDKGRRALEELVGKSKKALRKALRGKRQEKMGGFMEFEHFAGCRGETMLSLENQAQLYCYSENRWNPYFLINPVKTEVLSLDPVIGYFHELVGDQTVEFIRAMGERKMRRSGVVSEEDEEMLEVSPYRSSMSGWIPDPEEEGEEEAKGWDVDWGILEKLNKKIEKLTGLEVNKKGASNMQVVRYGAMGYYGFHWDSLAQAPMATEKEGDREATLLIYLTDTKMGGNTAFPYIGVHAKPKKGSAILFYSLKLNGEPDQRTIHGACPILLGTKEVANKWIMQYANMFKQPCSLYPDF